MCASMILCWLLLASAQAARGRLTIHVRDADSGQPIAARMHLCDHRGKIVKIPETVFWHDHFVVDGSVALELRAGAYRFELERGPEYKVRSGHFEIQDASDDKKTVTMQRFVNMNRHGWWSGDLHVHRSVEHIQPLMRAEDLNIAPVITWWNAGGRFRQLPRAQPDRVRFDSVRLYDASAGEDERDGGAVLFFNLDEPLDLTQADNHYPTSMFFVRQARTQTGAHIDVEKPFWWDMPVWVASGMVDSIGLANNHIMRHTMLDNEAWGRARDRSRFPPPHGNALWSQAIYYHILECGLRLAPSAGSASGVLHNPVGYNRAYVHCGDTLDWDTWWERLRAGRVVVTNGPLLVARVGDQLPGHVFRASAGDTLRLAVDVKLWTRDKIEYLEFVKNGKPTTTVRLEEWSRSKGELPRVEFKQSGWMLIRAVTTHPKTYRFASTGPYYVEFDDQPRISRSSAQFFVDWIDARMDRLSVEDATQRRFLQDEYRAARRFWQDLEQRATVD